MLHRCQLLPGSLRKRRNILVNLGRCSLRSSSLAMFHQAMLSTAGKRQVTRQLYRLLRQVLEECLRRCHLRQPDLRSQSVLSLQRRTSGNMLYGCLAMP